MLYRPAWVTVLTVALAMSWWSLYVVATHYGVPPVLAAGVSAIFDGAALICANLAHRYATSPHSGAGPRVALVGLLAGSVYLNVHHAQLETYGLPAQVMFAGPAVVAVALFELEQAWRNRAHRLAAGRIAPSLPVVGRWGWLFYPGRSLGVLRKVTRHRLESLATEHMAAYAVATGQVPTDANRKPVTADRDQAPQAVSTRKPAELTPGPRDRSDDTVTRPVTRDDRATGRADQGPTGPTATDQAATGRPSAIEHRREVKQAAGTGEAVAYAVSVTGSDRPAEISRWLTDHGRETSAEAVRSALRRARGRSGDRLTVVPFDQRDRA